MPEELILRKAIAYYGKDSQVKMAIEEMSELTKELCKNFRGRDNKNYIAEEIADVRIMLNQLEIMFEISDSVENWRSLKLQRLDDSLNMG